MQQMPGLRAPESLPRYNSLDRGRKKIVRRPLFSSRRSRAPSWLKKAGSVLLNLFLFLIFLALVRDLDSDQLGRGPLQDEDSAFLLTGRNLLADGVHPATYTLTIFTAPRAFDGPTGEKQRAALESWLALKPQPKVVLLGREVELGDVAGEYAPAVSWENKVDTNFLGLPLFHSMLLRARGATTDVAVLLEPDTILLPSFSTVVAKARSVAGQDWLLFLRHWEVQNFPYRVEQVFQDEEPDFSSLEDVQPERPRERRFRWVDPSISDTEVDFLWALELLNGEEGSEERYRAGFDAVHTFVRERGSLQKCQEVAVWVWDVGRTPLHSGIMPPFVYTRGSYSDWLLHESISDGQRQVIDASQAISAVRVLGSVANLQPYLGSIRLQNGEAQKQGEDKQAGVDHKLWKVGPKGAAWEIALNRHLAESYGTFGSDIASVNTPWRLERCDSGLCFFQRKESINTWAEDLELEECKKAPREKHELVALPMKVAELLPLVASPKGVVTLVVVANNYREMLLSFVCRLNALGIHNVVVGALDREAHQYASEQGLPVFSDVADVSIESPDDCHFGTQCFRDVTKLKSRTVLKILKLGYHVLMSDVDVIWFRDPTPIMMAYGPNTFVGQTDQHNDTGPANDERRFNSGFYLARAEATTIEALTAIAEHAATTNLSEQPSFQHVLCLAEGSQKAGGDECRFRNGLRVVFLDRKAFPNGASGFVWEKENTKEYCEKVTAFGPLLAFAMRQNLDTSNKTRGVRLLLQCRHRRRPLKTLLEHPKALRSCSKMSGRKETVLDLAKYVDKGVAVKLSGGREVTGTLKGYDQLLNLVLDEAIEKLRDPEDPMRITNETRSLGLIVCRGTAVMLVSPTDGTEEIQNPFLQQEQPPPGPE